MVCKRLAGFLPEGHRANLEGLKTVTRAEMDIAAAIDRGADLVIVNRFGRQECAGKGLSRLIEHALSADIPVVIAVPSHRFADWIKFADGMSVKLPCQRSALDTWWSGISNRMGYLADGAPVTMCEILK